MKYQVPAKFWDDYSERAPVDHEGQMAVEVSRKGNRVVIEADAEQVKYLRGDAAFYAEGNVDDSAALVRSAAATLKALPEAR